jgi:AcrR family transcriptional regulator
MRQIAARAGVGEPTLRRRFASKGELVAEAFEDKVGRYAGLALEG